jgi:hypothetical protein
MGDEQTRLYLGARDGALHSTYDWLAEDTDGQEGNVGVMGCVFVVVCGGWELMDASTSFRIPIYRCKLFVHLCDRIDVCYAKVHKEPIDSKLEGYEGLSSNDDGRFHLYFRPKMVSHWVVGHEVMHVTNDIMKYVGHKVVKDMDEPHAYLCGYITDRVYKFLKQKGIDVQ